MSDTTQAEETFEQYEAKMGPCECGDDVKKEKLVDRHNDFRKDDPTLTEVFEVFDGDELHVHRSRRSNLLLKWNQDDNRYTDPSVWSHNSHDGRVPSWAFELFRQVGVETK